ncbi:MAG TPA: hypothetical protein VM870_06535 [Pyrinomonadaceae bacterium]|jgi:hypothetical protein|nr:hypothetical protein [Pyrinomonadaceae bacterium]
MFQHLHAARRVIAGFLLFTIMAPLGSAAVALRAPVEDVTIPDGTEMSVVTMEEISSKTATEGDPLTFKVDEDLLINNQIVIAKGTVVKGVIASAERSGRLGKGGKLGIRVESTTTVDGQKIKLRASQSKTGDDKTGTTIALVALFGVFGFLKRGKEAKIKTGTKIKVYTDEEKKIQIKGGVI